MNRKIGELTRRMGLYGVLRSAKSRAERMNPRKVRQRRVAQLFYGNSGPATWYSTSERT